MSSDTSGDAPPTAAGVRAIVAGHGDFAAGLVSAVAQITGRGEMLVPVSNRDLSAQDVERTIIETADRTGARVIFIDLPAGSCAMAARRLLRGRTDLVVVMGVNLGTLIDFVFHDDVSALEAAQHAVERSKGPTIVGEARRAD